MVAITRIDDSHKKMRTAQHCIIRLCTTFECKTFKPMKKQFSHNFHYQITRLKKICNANDQKKGWESIWQFDF
jgi:hypothetical protein